MRSAGAALGALLVILVAGTGGGAWDAAPSAAAGHPMAKSVVPQPALPHAQEWWACRPGGDVQCTWLQVPLDHADPSAGTIRLPAARLPALDPKHRIGVLVTIPGGPGQRGTDLVRRGFHGVALERRFDIVSWDPRGTSGESAIDCIPGWDPFGDLDRTPDSASERLALDASIRRLADRCRSRHGGLLPFLGTHQTVLDLERLRKLLGEERISILGSSYGSQVGVVYATLFPHRVRALVLDGYSDPNAAPGEREVEQAAAFEQQLDELLAACAPDEACPLGRGEDPGAALDRLLARLDRQPMRIREAKGDRLREADAYEAILGALIEGGAARGRLLEALASAAHDHGGPLRRMADGLREAFESTGLNMGSFMAAHCADTGPYWDSLSNAQVLDLTERLRAAAPRLSPWLWSPPAAPDLPPIGLCAMRPRLAGAPMERVGPFDAAGAGPILVLATTGDASTPLVAAQRALHDLERAYLLVVEADHHLAYPRALREPDEPKHRCLLDVVEAYLIDPHEPPDASSCPDGIRLASDRWASTS